MMLRIVEEAARTDTGRQRHANEDSYYARSPIYVVADGMGGAQAGEVASRIAADAFDEDIGDGNPEVELAERAREANRRIFELAREDASHSGMGTTLTGALLSKDEVTIVHVGDSRAYLFRGGEPAAGAGEDTMLNISAADGERTTSADGMPVATAPAPVAPRHREEPRPRKTRSGRRLVIAILAIALLVGIAFGAIAGLHRV